MIYKNSVLSTTVSALRPPTFQIRACALTNLADYQNFNIFVHALSFGTRHQIGELLLIL